MMGVEIQSSARRETNPCSTDMFAYTVVRSPSSARGIDYRNIARGAMKISRESKADRLLVEPEG